MASRAPAVPADKQRPPHKRREQPASGFARFLPSRADAAVLALLAVLTTVAFWPVLSCQFVNFDDPDYVNNPHVMNGLTAKSVTWAFTTADVCNYWHPLTWLTLMAEHEYFGKGARGYHAVNLALHVGNALLVFVLMRRMTAHLGRSSWARSALVAALFALHPLRVESVAWVAELKDVLSPFFGLWAMVAYVTWTQRPNRSRYLFVMLLYALSLMAKPTLVTLPFLLLVLDYWPLGRLPIGAAPVSASAAGAAPTAASSTLRTALGLVYEKIPLFALAIGCTLITFLMQWHTMQDLNAIPLSTRVSHSIVHTVGYLETMFRFDRLAMLYPYRPDLSTAEVAGCTALLAGCTLAALVRLRQNPWLATGWFWFLGLLVPVIGLVQKVGMQSPADRFTYMPMIGILLLLVWSLPERLFVGREERTVLAAGTAALLVTLAVFTWWQCGYWRDSDTAFGRALAVTQGNYVMEHCLGSELANEGKLDDAIEHLSLAVKLKPDYAVAYVTRGKLYQRQHELRKAIEDFDDAIKADPRNAAGYSHRAMLLAAAPTAKLRNGKQALTDAEQACKLTDFRDAHNLVILAAAYAELGDFKQALRYQRQALELGSDDPQFRNYALGIMNEFRQGRALRMGG